MTGPAPTLCRRCGYANVPGDQFCGSCGAFLEWEGEASAASEAATEAVPDAVSNGPATASVASDAPAPTSGAADEAPASALVRCPSCGIANAAGRTLCQSCGATLPAEARVDIASATAAWIAKGGAAAPPPGATAATPGTARVTATAPRAASKPASGGSGGIPGWLFAMVGLGLVVGVVAVVLALTLGKPPEVPSGATTGPGASIRISPAAGTPDASGPAGSGAVASPGVTAAPVATPVPGAALPLTGATASSVVGGRAKFGAAMAIDGNPKTAWQEGAAEEAGQWLEVTFGTARVDSLVIRNGYQESEAAYFANRRLRDVRLTFDTGQSFEARLEDTMEPITVEVAGVTGATRVRIEIVSTWDPRKTAYAGSPFDDCALSEVMVIGVATP